MFRRAIWPRAAGRKPVWKSIHLGVLAEANGVFAYRHPQHQWRAALCPGGINKNIAGELKDNPRMVDSINRKLKDFLEKNISQGDPDIKRFFIDKDSLLWDRTLGSDSIECEKILSLGHIIVGHCPTENQLQVRPQNLAGGYRDIAGFRKQKTQVLVIGKDRNSEYRFNVVNVWFNYYFLKA